MIEEKIETEKKYFLEYFYQKIDTTGLVEKILEIEDFDENCQLILRPDNWPERNSIYYYKTLFPGTFVPEDLKDRKLSSVSGRCAVIIKKDCKDFGDHDISLHDRLMVEIRHFERTGQKLFCSTLCYSTKNERNESFCIFWDEKSKKYIIDSYDKKFFVRHGIHCQRKNPPKIQKAKIIHF